MKAVRHWVSQAQCQSGSEAKSKCTQDAADAGRGGAQQRRRTAGTSDAWGAGWWARRAGSWWLTIDDFERESQGAGW